VRPPAAAGAAEKGARKPLPCGQGIQPTSNPFENKHFMLTPDMNLGRWGTSMRIDAVATQPVFGVLYHQLIGIVEHVRKRPFFGTSVTGHFFHRHTHFGCPNEAAVGLAITVTDVVRMITRYWASRINFNRQLPVSDHTTDSGYDTGLLAPVGPIACINCIVLTVSGQNDMSRQRNR
jgi:hypothetical protein